VAGVWVASGEAVVGIKADKLGSEEMPQAAVTPKRVKANKRMRNLDNFSSVI
jgi:hypothetical protein